jgi:hypothetical protein
MLNYFEANIMELRDWGGRGWKEIYWDLWRMVVIYGDLLRLG